MKKITLPLLCAMMMLSCSGNKTQENVESLDSTVAATDSVAIPAEEEKTPHVEDIIAEQITSNYNAALKAGNEESSVKQYCSAAFITTYQKYQKAIEGEIGDIDYDLWLQAQDAVKPSAKVESITMKGENKAEVDVTISNAGTNTMISLVVVKDGEAWKIDDFVNAGQSVAKIMKDNIQAFSY